MSTVAGYFDETLLNNIRVKAGAIMFDDRINVQYKPHYDAIKAIQAVQTATVLPSIARDKKIIGVDVMWQNVCGQTVEDNTTCIVGGSKSSTNLKSYELSYEKVVKFSEDEADFIDNEFDIESAIAKQFLVADKNITENFAQYCISQIEAFRGWNTVTTGKGTVVGAETWIPPAYWDASLAAYFNRVAILNQFTSPVTLSGNNLYEQMYVADAKKNDLNGGGNNIMYGDMNMYFDLFNVDTVNDPTLKTYMLSTGSLAFGNRALNPERPQLTDAFTRYKIKSRFLPDMWYDVYYTTECTTNDLIQHNFKIKLNADLFNNPTNCSDHDTGVLSFACGTGA